MIDRKKYKRAGNYRHYDICRFCFRELQSPVIDLGYVPLAGGLMQSKKNFGNEMFYPLEVAFCENCFLVQSVNVINKDILFKNYFYYSSAIKTLSTHFTYVAEEMYVQLKKMPHPFVVEIGCNDATLIRQLTEKGIQSIGIDPAANIVNPLIKKKLSIINNYFTEQVAKNVAKQYSRADIICGFNVLAHIEDMHDVLKGIKILLKDDGFLLFETHYLGSLLKEIQYDMIYHEHQYYYSLTALQKFFDMYDMEIFDIRPIRIHGGSMRYYVQNRKPGQRPISRSVKECLVKEKQLKLYERATYLSYAKKVSKTRTDLLRLLDILKKQNKTIAGYGASGRGTIIMNYCNLNKKYLDYIIDDAPAKQGAYTPGNHLPIRSSTILQSKNKPDYILLFAWPFLREIKEKNKEYLKNGGKFILPLPKVEIINR